MKDFLVVYGSMLGAFLMTLALNAPLAGAVLAGVLTWILVAAAVAHFHRPGTKSWVVRDN